MFTRKTSIEQTLEKGLTYLHEQQQEDGSFLSSSTADSNNWDNALIFHSVFSTALLLDVLTQLPQTNQLEIIKQRSAAFLLAQKSKQWSFNYWARGSQESITMPYPDDLDDTFCALSALFHYDDKIIGGSVLSHVVRMLTLLEEKEGGPYRTWLVPRTVEKIWQDVDLAVNSNVAYFLALQGIDLPQVNHYIDTCIEKNLLTSPYYPSGYPIIYFISRFYKGKYKKKLREMLLTKKNTKSYWNNPLDTALCVTALLRLGIHPEEVDDSIDYILQQQANGLWKEYSFYTGVNPKKDMRYYAGSRALTTGFCLEACALYLKSSHATNSKAEQQKRKEETLYNKIVENVENRFSLSDETMRTCVLDMIQTILTKDVHRQIVLLPYYFAQALGNKKNDISEELLMKLGMANLLGWIAYTIYDDFLDDEGDPKMLSFANIALRELTSIFEHVLSQNDEFVRCFHTIMDQLDQANTWEIMHCRIKSNLLMQQRKKGIGIPDYGTYEQLAQKSLGHALGPVTILFALGYTEDSSEMRYLKSFFSHYLIARQLNDDAHDWEEDLRKGQINSVGALLLHMMDEKKQDNNTNSHVYNLQELFWYEGIEKVCLLIQYHTTQARIVLKKCAIIKDVSLFEQLLGKYDKSAQTALDERRKAIEFLQQYAV